MCDRLSPEKLRELLAVARAIEAEHQRTRTGLPPEDFDDRAALMGKPQPGPRAEQRSEMRDRRKPGASRHPDLERRDPLGRNERRVR
jgi:hypothetical protein